MHKMCAMSLVVNNFVATGLKSSSFALFYLFINAYELIVECWLEVGAFNFVTIATSFGINRLRKI